MRCEQLPPGLTWAARTWLYTAALHTHAVYLFDGEGATPVRGAPAALRFPPRRLEQGARSHSRRARTRPSAASLGPGAVPAAPPALRGRRGRRREPRCRPRRAGLRNTYGVGPPSVKRRLSSATLSPGLPGTRSRPHWELGFPSPQIVPEGAAPWALSLSSSGRPLAVPSGGHRPDCPVPR